MDFVALLSGGKDSCFNTFKCLQHGHRLVCLAHLKPTPVENVEGEETNSFMYQTAGSTVLTAYEECFGVPMIQRHIVGSSVNTGMEYNEVCPGDEVEDLYELLKDVQVKYPTVKAVACGAILSNYQRHRLEHVCGRLGLTVLSYLWQKERKELLEEMILEHNMDIMLVKVAGAGLQPRKHLGKRLKDLYPQLLKLHKKYGLDLCGEGGEYESLVLDAPYFRKRIEIVATKIIEDPEDPDVGNLYVLDHHVVDKEIPNSTVSEAEAAADTPAYPRFESAHQQLNKALALSSSSSSSSSSSAVPSLVDNLHQPRTSPLLARKPVKIHWKEDGFGHTELITAMGTAAGGEAESSLSVVYRAQLTEVMNRLVYTLTVVHGLRQEDIAFVHLYLQDMTMFAVANEVYCQYFQRYPPSRSCVQLALPTGGSVVAVEACILRHSYNTMLYRAESASASASSSSALPQGHSTRREVLHVQSMSQWAPLCIGPYCQANILQDFFLFVAGQIPLQPGTMTLRPHRAPVRSGEVPWLSREDLLLDMTLSLRHVHRVLSVLQSDLHHLLSVIVYVNTAYTVVEGEAEEEGRQQASSSSQSLSSSTKGVGGEVSLLWTSARVLMERLCRQNAFVGDSGVAIADAIQQHATDGNAAKEEGEEEEEYAEDFDAYDIDQDDQAEAEERHRKAQASAHAVLPPIVFVGVPGLPRNASCEIEVIAAKTDRVRATGWKQVQVTERESMTTTAADGRGLTVVVNANDVDSWPIWSSDASSVSSSRPVGGKDAADATEPLVGQALVKTYPGTVCSGVVDVLVPHRSTGRESAVDVGRMLAVGVSTLQRTLREEAAMRPNRLLYVKVLYDPAVVGSLVTPDMVCQWWKDAWLHYAAVAASSSSAANTAASSLLPVASTMALPVSFLQPSTTTTTPHAVALHVLFFAADAHQLETESWIKLASNHCQGS